MTISGALLPDAPNEVDYIRNGLVFRLDGIDKGGEDGVWRDLVGGLEFRQLKNHAGVIWGDDFVAGALGADVGINYPYNTSTIEFTYQNKATYNTLAWFAPGAQKGIMAGFYTGWLVMGYGDPNAMLTYKDMALSSVGIHLLSANANLKLHNLTADNSPSSDDYWAFRENYAKINAPNIRIRSIRIYDRLLTEAEMRHNQKVDIQRFGLSVEDSGMTLNYNDEEYAPLPGLGLSDLS